MRIADGQTDSLFAPGLVAETDWQALAPAAGGIGRFAMDMETGQAEIDLTLRRLTGMTAVPATFPLATFLERIDEADRPLVALAIEESRATGGAYEATFRFQKPGGDIIWLEGHGRPLATADGRTLLIGVNYDVTQQRVAQERAELLAGEMAHRIKNVFALVQSMFNMAARTAPDVPTLVQAFTGRLNALAQVNALTFADDNRRVALDDLTRSVLGPLIDAGRVRPTLTPGFALSGTAAQTVVLALNELMTNGVKYGALMAPEGSVDLSMTADGAGFVLRWHEVTPHKVTAPEGPTGFGMRVLSGMTRATYGGDPDFQWRPDGLTFTCRWPLKGFGHDDGSYAAPVVDEVVAVTKS